MARQILRRPVPGNDEGEAGGHRDSTGSPAQRAGPRVPTVPLGFREHREGPQRHTSAHAAVERPEPGASQFHPERGARELRRLRLTELHSERRHRAGM